MLVKFCDTIVIRMCVIRKGKIIRKFRVRTPYLCHVLVTALVLVNSFIFSHVTVINKHFDIHLDKYDSENKMTSKRRSSIKLLLLSYLSNCYQHKYIDGSTA